MSRQQPPGEAGPPSPQDSSLDELRTWFEPCFRSAVPPDYAEPRLLHAVMVYACRYGKRIRPLLCLASAAACGGELDEALPAAVAVELIHSYSLVHDDLPAMDDDEARRGVPSAHARYGEGLAVLAGDALLTAAFGALAAPRGNSPGLGATVIAAASKIEDASWAARRLATVRELAVGAGSLGMVAGQAVELIATTSTISGRRRWAAPAEELHLIARDRGDGTDPGARESLARYIAEHKTGALFRVACRAGGLAGCADRTLLGALTRFGATYGLAYQALDDLVDRQDDERSERSLNVAVLLGKEGATELFARAKDAAWASLAAVDWPGPVRWLEDLVGVLEALARDVGSAPY